MKESKDLKSNQKKGGREYMGRTRSHFPNFTKVPIFQYLREMKSQNHLFPQDLE